MDKVPGVQLLRSRPAALIIQTALKWQRDDCLEMGAALSYYALFSLFPTVLIVLSIVGAFIGPESGASEQILLFARSSLPPEAYSVVDNTLSQLNRNSLEAGIISFLILCFTASGVFGALTRSMNKIWQVHRESENDGGVKSAAKTFMRNRFLAFVLVFSTSALIFLSLVSKIVIEVVIEIVKDLENAVGIFQIDDLLVLKTLQTSTSYLCISAVIMLLFKVLPNTRISWRDVCLGGLVTSGLFMLLQHLASNSIIRVGEQFLSYGAVGSVMILLLWIFLSCQVFFLGCELTYVYTYLFGSRNGLYSCPESLKVDSK
ncbi:YihY/virulence factor BrkB family protein [Oscillatoria sp. CS-180]|uniref:YihY/virulence factor BrkB family protein n=1 Tax=Oscillatoria sp. CS-180 TaxID=3021720 RepID=UPI00232C207B|nr:YihY/virulence factor BrkB family protein [Oscillatoria sp. CS-180]MDB9529270.1 YihY/virulence factor BrkB family protein [Oscillatoria sp. CS-180]